jgi:hypothetical protein
MHRPLRPSVGLRAIVVSFMVLGLLTGGRSFAADQAPPAAPPAAAPPAAAPPAAAPPAAAPPAAEATPPPAPPPDQPPPPATEPIPAATPTPSSRRGSPTANEPDSEPRDALSRFKAAKTMRNLGIGFLIGGTALVIIGGGLIGGGQRCAGDDSKCYAQLTLPGASLLVVGGILELPGIGFTVAGIRRMNKAEAEYGNQITVGPGPRGTMGGSLRYDF